MASDDSQADDDCVAVERSLGPTDWAMLVILGLLLTMGVLYALAASSGAADLANATGMAHAEIAAMSVGGDGAVRFHPIALYAYLFNMAFLLVGAALVWLAVPQRRRTLLSELALLVIAIIALSVSHYLFAGYERFLDTGLTIFVTGVPLPSFLTLVGGWVSFFLYCLYYYFTFARLFHTKGDEQAFQALVAANKSVRGV